MPIVTPTLNLPQPTTTTSTKTATPAIPAPAPLAAPVATPGTPAAPSATVTLSPQALSLAAASHPAASGTTSAASAPAPVAPHDGSVYESLKMGISNAVTDVEDAIASGAHAVVDGVEHTLSTANDIAKGILELPFAALSKASDGVGALIDEL